MANAIALNDESTVFGSGLVVSGVCLHVDGHPLSIFKQPTNAKRRAAELGAKEYRRLGVQREGPQLPRRGAARQCGEHNQLILQILVHANEALVWPRVADQRVQRLSC